MTLLEELTASTSPGADAMILMTDDLGGTPADKKASLSNVTQINKMGARVRRTTTQTISSVGTAVGWDTEEYDYGGMSSLTSQNTKIFAPVDGVYLCSATLPWFQSATDIYYGHFQVDGSSLSHYGNVETRPSVNTANYEMYLADIIPLSAGSYVEVIAIANGPNSIIPSGNNPHFSMTLLHRT